MSDTRRPVILTAVLLGILVCIPVAAQTKKPVQGHFGGGVAFPLGDIGDALETGWTLSGGATFWPKPESSIGYRVDFGVDWFDIDESVLRQIDTDPGVGFDAADDGDAWVWRLTGDVVWKPAHGNKMDFYVLGGAGVYYVQANLGEVGYVPGYWCDWWYGWCYPTLVPGEYTIQDQSSWEWGLNAGLGVSFNLQSGGEFYIEAVYQWVDTPKAAAWVPLTIGGRW